MGIPDSSFRSLKPDFTKKLITKLNNKYNVFIVKAGNQEGIEHINTFNNPVREIIALIPYVKAIVSVDSFMQHGSAAMNKSCFTYWSSTRESNLGYDMHKNHRNNQDFVWSPVRIFMNDPSLYSKNKHVNEFTDEDMEACISWVNIQIQPVKPNTATKQSSCSSCK